MGLRCLEGQCNMVPEGSAYSETPQVCLDLPMGTGVLRAPTPTSLQPSEHWRSSEQCGHGGLDHLAL